MIDHVSVAVRDLEAATRYYENVLGALGMARLATRRRRSASAKNIRNFGSTCAPMRFLRR